jgi:hypothetical protein
MNINKTTYYQVYNKSNIVKEETEAPIYNQILDISHIEIHKLIQVIKSKKGVILDISTDCVSCVCVSIDTDAVDSVDSYFLQADCVNNHGV